MAKVKIHSSTKTNIFDTSLGVLAKLNIVVKKKYLLRICLFVVLQMAAVSAEPHASPLL